MALLLNGNGGGTIDVVFTDRIPDRGTASCRRHSFLQLSGLKVPGNQLGWLLTNTE
jgi:hypothetical protein